MNGSHHAASVHAANCITLRFDMLHMVKNLKIAYGMSWKSKKTSWKKKGQKVGLCMSNTSRWICVTEYTG